MCQRHISGYLASPQNSLHPSSSLLARGLREERKGRAGLRGGSRAQGWVQGQTGQYRTGGSEGQ